MEGRRRLDSLRIAPEDVFRESVKNTGPGSDSQPSSSAKGWLRSDELLDGAPYGSLAEDDPRGQHAPVTPLPMGWRAALVTEQWAEHRPDAEVNFSLASTSVASAAAACAPA